MQVHHLNCGTLHPIGGRWLRLASQPRLAEPHMVCHCLLIETGEGLVLVDTGLGTADVEHAVERLQRPFVAAMRPRLAREETALAQVEARGFAAGDVRHIVLTHLDLDHAGGLSDFPRAKVHVLADEHAAAQARSHFKERDRYRPMQWSHDPDWALYRPAGDNWFGFECVRELEGLPPEILMVPLTGHTRGHAAVAVDGGEGWLLHAGDAYFHTDEVMPTAPACPLALRLFQRTVAIDNRARLDNQARLRELAADHGAELRMFCAHDPDEFQRHRGG